MGNTPCAHAVDSVLHQRVEIKVDSGLSAVKKKPPRRMALLTIFVIRLLNSFINYFLAVLMPSRLYAGQLPIIPVTSGMMPIQPQAPTMP